MEALAVIVILVFVTCVHSEHQTVKIEWEVLRMGVAEKICSDLEVFVESGKIQPPLKSLERPKKLERVSCQSVKWTHPPCDPRKFYKRKCSRFELIPCSHKSRNGATDKEKEKENENENKKENENENKKENENENKKENENENKKENENENKKENENENKKEHKKEKETENEKENEKEKEAENENENRKEKEGENQSEKEKENEMDEDLLPEDISASSSGKMSGGATRTIGGDVVKPGEVPYIANVFLKEERICSGTIISHYCIVLLASCFQGRTKTASDYTVVAGQLNLDVPSPTEQRFTPHKLILHPQHKDYVNDIGLLELAQPILLNQAVGVANLSDIPEEPSGNLTVSGWGQSPISPQSNALRKVIVPILNRTFCEIASVDMNQDVLCTYSLTASHCETDAGGPMVQVQVQPHLRHLGIPQVDNGKEQCPALVAIIQSAKACGFYGHPSIGLRVTRFIPWIQENVNPLVRQTPNKTLSPGTNAILHEFPYHVRILKDGVTICGGTILNTNYILTAASCIQGETVTNSTIKIIAGDHNGMFDEEAIQVRTPMEFILHHKYDRVTHKHDIALIRLSTPLIFSLTVLEADLVPPEFSHNEQNTLHFVGWGSVGANVSNESTLKNILMNLIGDEECANKYGCALWNLHPFAICANAKNANESSCRGDFGGALTSRVAELDYKILGIASYRIGCEDENYPTIFTYVPEYFGWLKDEMEETPPRIANPDEAPYQALIFPQNYIACGGAILNDRFIITAAQCFLNVHSGNLSQVSVFVGKHHFNETGAAEQNLTIKTLSIHPKFSESARVHDIALVETTSSIQFNEYVHPIFIANSTTQNDYDRKAESVGYGLEEIINRGVLQILPTHVINNLYCKRSHKWAGKHLTDDILCSASRLSGNCIGDPGGPLIQHIPDFSRCKQLLGVLSIERNCHVPFGFGAVNNSFMNSSNSLIPPNATELPGLPGVYTHVFKYKDWITEVMMSASRKDSGIVDTKSGSDSGSHLRFRRVAGGENAQPNEFPFQVQVVVGSQVVCGGAILNPHYILTSAICATKVENASASVRTGAAPESQRIVIDIIKHEDFDIITRENDIAILVIVPPIDFTTGAGNIFIAQSTLLNVSTMLTFSGWGTVASNASAKPTALQKIVLKTMAINSCWDIFYHCGIYSGLARVFCADVVGPTNKGICEGDQGSPATITEGNQTVLVGIASWRTGCSEGIMYPGVFTHVPHYSNWIQSHIHLESHFEAFLNDFPTQVLVLYKNQPHCVGTLVSISLVLAPHLCFVGTATTTPVSDWTVAAGDDGIGPTRAPQIRTVTSIITNAGLSNISQVDDVFIMKLNMGVVLSDAVQIAKIAYAKDKPSLAESLTVSTWNVPGQFKLLLKIKVSPVSQRECELVYEGVHNITGSLFCVSPTGARCNSSAIFHGPLLQILPNGCHLLQASSSAPCFSPSRTRHPLYNDMSPPVFSEWIDLQIEEAEQMSQQLEMNTVQNQFPFLARIILGSDRLQGKTLCVGAIIGSDFMVAPASCVEGFRPNEISIVAGDWRSNVTERSESIARANHILIHEGYDNVTRANNIALLNKVNFKLDNRNVFPAQMGNSSENFPPASPVHVAGFGNALRGNVVVYTNVTHENLQVCKEDYKCSQYPLLGDADDKVRCGVMAGGFGPGFYGAPMFSISAQGRPVVHGIQSFRRGCGGQNCTWVFTNVEKYEEWIVEKGTGGQGVMGRDYRFHAHIFGRGSNTRCAGVLIGEYYVLTTARCMEGNDVTKLRLAVIAGVVQLDLSTTIPGQQQRNVLQIFMHKDFNFRTRENDIALLRVGEPFKVTDFVGFALLPSLHQSPVGETYTSGFYSHNRAPVRNLRYTMAPIISQEECKAAYSRANFTVTSTMICTSNQIPPFCFNEVGSPLTQHVGNNTCRTVFGLATGTFDCTRNRFPNIYTNVSSFVQFIQANIDKTIPLPDACYY